MIRKKEIINKKLTIILNDDMIKFAKEQGYKIPCISIKKYFGFKGVFETFFEDNNPVRYELNVYNQNNECVSIYLM